MQHLPAAAAAGDGALMEERCGECKEMPPEIVNRPGDDVCDV